MKVHKTTYAIRKGFEFQDLYCAVQILGRIEHGEHGFRFEIESDSVQFVDDLKIVASNGSLQGHQVKFHTTQEAHESFQSLTNSIGAGGMSLLAKLHAGWRSLSDGGHKNCDIRYVSSAPPDSSFGRLIDSATHKLNARLLSAPESQTFRDELCSHLDVDPNELDRFLRSVTWTLGQHSVTSLRESVRDSLKRLKLPDDLDAVSVVLDLIGDLATEARSALSVPAFLTRLAERRTFREACEEAFPSLIQRIRGAERATIVRVALVSMVGLPAFAGREYSCLEEAAPADGHWPGGITDPTLIGKLGGLRQQLRDDYLAWTESRIQTILGTLEAQHVDAVVFSRYAVPAEVIGNILDWCVVHNCNAILGGHSSAGTSSEADGYARMGLKPSALPTNLRDGSLVPEQAYPSGFFRG